MTTTYTVLSRQGEIEGRGLSLAEAASEILTYDGREYEIRPPEGAGYWLWRSQQVADRPWERTSEIGRAHV